MKKRKITDTERLSYLIRRYGLENRICNDSPIPKCLCETNRGRDRMIDAAIRSKESK